MIKTIHLIKTGPFYGFSDHEISCIESWKRVYPDFEIRFWGDSECLPMIKDCPYIENAFNAGIHVGGVDYCKLRILYEYGGLYMDTDVFCLNRIPDRYFEKAFFPWDAGSDTEETNNGTVCYTEPHNPIFKEMCEEYENLPLPREDVSLFLNNHKTIFPVLKRHGFKNDEPWVQSEKDQDLGDLVIVNRVQFGVNDYRLGFLSLDKEREPYMVHCYVSMWATPTFLSIYQNSNEVDVGIHYMIIDDNTSEKEIGYAVNRFTNTKIEEGDRFFKMFIFFLNTTSGKEKPFAQRIQINCPKYYTNMKSWITYPLGNGLSSEVANASALNFIIKRFKRVRYCKNVLRGEV